MNRLWIPLLAALIVAAIPGLGRGQQDAGEKPDYTFGPEDILEINVLGKEEFTGEVTVDFRGRIQVPLIGEVRVSGRSPSELGEFLTQRYQLLDPGISEVLVSVVEYKSRTVTVVGEVRSPGPYGFAEIPSLWDVILTAGGPQADADLSRVQIVRGQPQPGEVATMVVDLSAGILATHRSALPELRPTDKVFVPSAEDVPVGSQDFQVIGAVAAPGTYRISVATNVVEALSASGGPLRDADLKKVYVTRETPEGTKSFRLNLEDYLFAAQTPANLDLLAGDTVTVPEKSGFVTSWSRVSGIIIPLVSLAITAVWASRS